MFQPTAHFFDETLDDRKAKPQTGGTCVVEALEGHENVVDLFFRDSGAVVDHADFHAVLHGAAGQQHLGIRGVRAGVDQQVTHHRIEAGGGLFVHRDQVAFDVLLGSDRTTGDGSGGTRQGGDRLRCVEILDSALANQNQRADNSPVNARRVRCADRPAAS